MLKIKTLLVYVLIFGSEFTKDCVNFTAAQPYIKLRRIGFTRKLFHHENGKLTIISFISIDFTVCC